MITRRDQGVIDFLGRFKAAKTSTLCQLFYGSYRVCTRRLSLLSQEGTIKRQRDGWSTEYIYYTKKPRQLRHSLLLTDFYRELHKIADIKRFIPEPVLGEIRPDAVVGFELGGQRLALVEVQISNNDDCKKYDTWSWQSHFPVEPELIVISDRPVQTKYKTTVIGTDLTELSI